MTSINILEAVISDDIRPERRGGVVMYEAALIDRVFEWAERQDHRIEWVEGLFYDPNSDGGQMSTDYIVELQDAEYVDFRATCLRLASEIQLDARKKGMKGYFEIGISN